MIEVDGTDSDDDVAVYENWVQSCPRLAPITRVNLLAAAVAASPPIARAELFAQAVAAIANHPATVPIPPAIHYWADQGPRIPARLLADLIGTEMTEMTSRGATFRHVRNSVRPKRRTMVTRHDLTLNRQTLQVDDLVVLHPFDQVHNAIVPVFTLDDRMIAWREALPPHPDDDREPSESDASAGDVGVAK